MPISSLPSSHAAPGALSCNFPSVSLPSPLPPLTALQHLHGKAQTLYILAHQNPDADVICSALALEIFFTRLGIKAKATLPSRPQGEGAFVLQYLHLENPPLLTSAKGRLLFLVDHSSYAHALPDIKEGKVIGLLDHHQGGDIPLEELAFSYCQPVGSTCTLLYALYEKAHLLPSTREAALLLAGLLADTRRLTLNVTPLDQAVHERLLPLSGIEEPVFYEEMRKAASQYAGLSDKEIFLSDYKAYTPDSLSFGVAVVQVLTEEEKKDMAFRMRRIMSTLPEEGYPSLLYCIIASDDSMLLFGNGPSAAKLLSESFSLPQGDTYTFRPLLSRKTGLVPALTATLLRYQREESMYPS